MTIFYAPDILHEPILPEEESAHAIRVLRMQAGDEVLIVDGAGGLFRAEISSAHQKRCEVRIIEQLQDFNQRDFKIHIAIAPTKNIERFEWFIEKVTEIGVDEITPLLTRFSERKIIKPERLQKIIISASKQSQKASFPVLNPLVSFDDFIKGELPADRFIAHCYKEEKNLLKNAYSKSNDALILIGPEGDFSTEEVENALSIGFKPVSLGDSRLRTETAGLVACATIHFVNQ